MEKGVIATSPSVACAGRLIAHKQKPRAPTASRTHTYEPRATSAPLSNAAASASISPAARRTAIRRSGPAAGISGRRRGHLLAPAVDVRTIQLNDVLGASVFAPARLVCVSEPVEPVPREDDPTG